MPNSKHIIQQLLQTHDTSTTALLVMMIDHFGIEFTEWTPQTVRMEIEENLHIKPSVLNFGMLMAGVSLLTQDNFYWSVPDFNDLCNTLSGELIHPGMCVPADAAACAWGITEAMLISPPDNLDKAFTPEIQGYVGEVLAEEGILSPPDVLKIGHFDAEILHKLKFSYSDDPEMFDGIFQSEQSKTEDINAFVKNRLRAVIEQLQALKLKNGKVERVAEMMLKALPEPAEDEELSSAIL